MHRPTFNHDLTISIEMKSIKTTFSKRLRSELEQAIELAIDNKKLRTELNGALMLFKSSAPGVMKKTAISILENYGGYIDPRVPVDNALIEKVMMNARKNTSHPLNMPNIVNTSDKGGRNPG